MVPSPVSLLSLLLLEDEDELSLGSWAALSPLGGFSGGPPSFSFRLQNQVRELSTREVVEVIQVRPQPVQVVAAESAVEAAVEQ